jgi:hypothetical protein
MSRLSCRIDAATTLSGVASPDEKEGSFGCGSMPA